MGKDTLHADGSYITNVVRLLKIQVKHSNGICLCNLTLSNYWIEC